VAFGGYKRFADGDSPPLRTHEEVVAGGKLATEARQKAVQAVRDKAERDNRELKPEELQVKFALPPECKGVTGESQLLRLPYFNIVNHTILDMMHIISGCVGRHLVPLCKGKRLTSVLANLPRFDDLDPAPEDDEPTLEAKTLRRAEKRWHRTEGDWKTIEKHCMEELQAPSGIAHCRPFSRTGEMTAHHWVNFVKSYGKHLFAQHYQGPVLILLCEILDLLRLCLSSSLTPQIMEQIDVLSKNVANWFDILMPPIEMAMVFHLLVFHIPDTIRRWGPARGMWCFPFER
jgi:hypothetical protein